MKRSVENLFGCKMVKWIQTIEFLENVQAISNGERGYAKDHECFGELATV